MLGFLSYLPTFYGVPHTLFALCLLVVGWRWYKSRGTISIAQPTQIKMGAKEWILVLIVLLSSINHLLHIQESGGGLGLIPYTLFLLLTYGIAKTLTAQDIMIWMVLGACETGVMFYEFLEGINTVFVDHPGYAYTGDREYLYFRRAYGLSHNSSAVANKLLVILLVADYFKMNKPVHKILKAMLCVGMGLSFNRTIWVVLIVYGIFRLLQWLLSRKWTRRDVKIASSIAGFLFLGGLIFMFTYGQVIFDQFTRGNGYIEMSGRNFIWADFVAFIKENSWLGNGSHKYYLHEAYHAHNSFLQVLATHGVVIFALYILFVLMGITYRNFTFVFVLLLYSFTQYGLFWGVSMMDIALMVFIFKPGYAMVNEKRSKVALNLA